jgi:pyridoxal phosphate enzyme (YggS family)
MNATQLETALERVREEIGTVQQAEGLRHPVRIVAVTKGHPPAVVRAAHEAGLADIGENRVQEALDKQGALRDLPLRWHLIGHLQTNKARYIPGAFRLVHSVDSVRVAEALAQAVRRAADRPAQPVPDLGVLIQVNVAGEAQKTGCAPGMVEELAGQVATFPGLDLQGLMTMAPFTDDERVQRKVFAGLRALRDRLAAGGVPLRELSMGMSGDFRAAVAEGATILRLGTVLFGERQT